MVINVKEKFDKTRNDKSEKKHTTRKTKCKII